MKCRACGIGHDPLVRCEVAGRLVVGMVESTPVPKVIPPYRVSGWPTREAYNGYMREYMRRRRLKA